MSDRAAAEIDDYRVAAAKLLGLIRGEKASSRSPAERRLRAEARMERSAALLRHLGNPQRTYPIVHITGTSGKGSTAAAIAAILTSAGYRVGLRTSPYLQVMTEKLQIGSSLIDAPSFRQLTDRVWTVAEERLPQPSGPAAGYAEFWVAMSLSWFAERKVDVAIVEVGAGGRFDSTNVVTPAVSVITSVGLDHVISLGPTLADIAWHKAGIVKPGVPVVVGELPEIADAVVSREADNVGSEVIRVPADLCLALPQRPSFAKVNARIAVTAINALRPYGLTAGPGAIAAGLAQNWLAGRFERMPGNDSPAVWVDSAHNPDKMAALASAWAALHDNSQPPVIVLGILGSKDGAAMLSRLTLRAAAFVATTPVVHGKRSQSANAIAAEIRASGRAEPVYVEPDSAAALTRAIDLARELDTDVLATGSLYLAGEIRRHWYPDEEIVLQRTPWPKVRARDR